MQKNLDTEIHPGERFSAHVSSYAHYISLRTERISGNYLNNVGVVILKTAWFAWLQWSQIDQPQSHLAQVGALLFVTTDTLLALNRFRGLIKSAPRLILHTYFTPSRLL